MWLLPRCPWSHRGVPAAILSLLSGDTVPHMTKEEELDFLRGQAEAIKGQLEQLEARMRELETEG